MHGLKTIRVIDFSSWIAGPYTSKLFADAGADVVKVETGDGDPLRRWSSSHDGAAPQPGDSAFFKYLNASKRSVTGRPDDRDIVRLMEGADLVIEDFPADSPRLEQLDIGALRERFPHLVVLSITPFGRTGPYAGRPATEFTIQAESAAIASRGRLTEPPYMAGGRTTDFVGATYAAVAALAAVRAAQATGRGEHIDFSLTEVMNLAASIYLDLMFSLLGRPEMPGPYRSVEIPSIEPTRDGWVGFTTNSRQQFNDFLLLIERPDLMEDEELASVFTRQNRMEEWNSIVHAWTTRHTTAEIVERASLLRIPVAPVNNGQTVLEHEQFIARGVFEKNPGGNFLQPRPPYRINGQRITTLKPAPGLGEHNGSVEARPERPPARSGDTDTSLPLAGLRVLDATAWWAGPAATQMLAFLGADVIHLESVQRLDGSRTVVVLAGHDTWWETSHLHNGTNTNKRDVTLNLSEPEGLSLAKRLIAECDIVVENFSPRVFENFGLDWNTIHEINPSALYVRMPAFGLDGPWRDHVGFAQTMEQMSGLAWLTGHKEDQPRIQRGPCDPLAGMHAAFAMLVGLAEREASGEGQFLECTMVEGALNAAAEQVIEYTAYGRVLQREGNRSPYAAPQGLYACRGEENWLALSVATDAQWQSLVELMGDPDWASAGDLNTHAGRRAAHDLIDKRISDWARDRELTELIETLLSRGIPAASLLNGWEASEHPQLTARGFFESVEHPVIGTHPIPTVPFRFAGREGKNWIRRPAPMLGEHNREILTELLGLSEAEISELEEKSIIGNVPAGL